MVKARPYAPRFIRFGVLSLALTIAHPSAPAQTVSYTLPEPGAYPCSTTQLMPSTRYNGFTNQVETYTQIVPTPSALGTLTLEPGNKWRLSSGARGTYRAGSDGALKFTGYLGGPQFTSAFAAKDGAFELTIVYRSKPNDTGLTSSCTRESSRAQMVVKGSPNPGMGGKLVFSQQDRVYSFDVATGRAQPLADGTLGYGARNGDLIYQNGAGQLLVVTQGGQVALKLDPEASRSGASGFSYDVRREDLALSPDGRFLVYSADDIIQGYRVVVRDRTGREAAVLRSYTSANFTPDGRLLLVGHPDEGGPSGLFLTDQNFTNLRRLDPNLDFPNCPSASPDGKRVAFVQGGKLWTVNIDGTGARTLPTVNAKAPNIKVYGWPAWSPDGKWLALTADGDGSSTGGVEVLLVPASGDASKLQWLGDSQLDFVHTSGDRLSWR